MSPKNSLLATGLTALGLFGSAVRGTVAADDAPASPSAPVSVSAAAADAPRTVHLLSNGRVLHGLLELDGTDYVLKQKGGVIRFQKNQVEQSFASLVDAYDFKRSQIPEGDPDEHLKLARWCLFNKLEPQATVELQKVLAVAPKSLEAKAMLGQLQAKAERLAMARDRAVDAAVVQTGGTAAEGAEPTAAAMPEEPAARPKRGRMEIPPVFDLPPAQAAVRVNYFAQYVHPILQASCVRCHDEKHRGTFQLVAIKNRRDDTPTTFRANLDATLGLVDPSNPARSELLSRALVPHGGIPAQTPLFRGSGDLRYQRLATWVNGLRSTSAAAATAAGAANAPRDGQVSASSAAGAGAGFASERHGSAASPALPLPFTPTPSGPAIAPTGTAGPEVGVTKEQAAAIERVTPPSTRYVPGRGMVVENMPPGAGEFPVSPLVGGAGTAMPRPAGAAMPPGQMPPQAAPGGPATLPGPPPLPATLPNPAAAPGAPATDPAAVPNGAPAPAPATADAAPKKPAKPVKIDPALLERALINRNSGR